MKYTRIHIGLFVLLSGFLGASCSEDAAREYSFGESIPLGVEGLNLEATSATRVGGTLVTTEGGAIRVFLTGEGGYTPMYDKTYTYVSGGWSSTDPVYVDKRTGKVVAVYDPKGLVSFGVNNTVTTNALQAQAYSEDQLWYYDNTSGTGVNSTNAASTFSMKCAYSRLSFSISHHVNYTFDCKVSRIVIKPSAGTFYTAAKVNIADGALAGTLVANYTIDTSTLSMNTDGIGVGSIDTSIDQLFPAQTLAAGAGLTFTLCVDGMDYSAVVPAAIFNEIKAGVHYTVELMMTGEEITVGSVSTTDWVASGSNIDSKFD